MLRKVLPHAAIIISVVYFVFFFIDRVNSAMAFIDNDMTKVLLFVLGVISILDAFLIIADDRRRTRLRQKKLEQKKRQQLEKEKLARARKTAA